MTEETPNYRIKAHYMNSTREIYSEFGITALPSLKQDALDHLALTVAGAVASLLGGDTVNDDFMVVITYDGAELMRYGNLDDDTNRKPN